MIILFSAYLSCLSSSSSGGLTRLLLSSCMYTCNKSFDTIFSSGCHQWRRKYDCLILGIAQPEDGVESNFKSLL